MDKCECKQNINNDLMYHYICYCPYSLSPSDRIQPMYNQVINNHILKIGECAHIAWGSRGDIPCFVRNNNNILEFAECMEDLYGPIQPSIHPFIKSYKQIYNFKQLNI